MTDKKEYKIEQTQDRNFDCPECSSSVLNFIYNSQLWSIKVGIECEHCNKKFNLSIVQKDNWDEFVLNLTQDYVNKSNEHIFGKQDDFRQYP